MTTRGGRGSSNKNINSPQAAISPNSSFRRQNTRTAGGTGGAARLERKVTKQMTGAITGENSEPITPNI